ncbi:hypothetical protein DSCO28_60140 [Desulfosarcina ovata subsp. sediminis]|uniref:Uncharacterized protein n=1 Tax=Desulfosarcina ovata subsp. sediminis TaxID=885957 RepID=A0A5K7ZZ06_9BACT|nr:hypothetical protein [Desulfosarcina ovata]BBO85448.1 hypothetical protein DSCO28_60140 [Desulfosarcina ovata subsp. sediminis]
MKAGAKKLLVWSFFVLIYSISSAWAGISALQDEAINALKQAMTRLDNPTDVNNIVCLTNAGYAMVQDEGTLMLCKTVRDVCGVSADTGNILRVHSDLDAHLYFALAHRTGPDTLLLVMVSHNGETFMVSEKLDVYVKKGNSFESLKLLGPQAFSVVSIANGWANDFPEDLLPLQRNIDVMRVGQHDPFFPV